MMELVKEGRTHASFSVFKTWEYSLRRLVFRPQILLTKKLCVFFQPAIRRRLHGQWMKLSREMKGLILFIVFKVPSVITRAPSFGNNFQCRSINNFIPTFPKRPIEVLPPANGRPVNSLNDNNRVVFQAIDTPFAGKQIVAPAVSLRWGCKIFSYTGVVCGTKIIQEGSVFEEHKVGIACVGTMLALTVSIAMSF